MGERHQPLRGAADRGLAPLGIIGHQDTNLNTGLRRTGVGSRSGRADSITDLSIGTEPLFRSSEILTSPLLAFVIGSFVVSLAAANSTATSTSPALSCRNDHCEDHCPYLRDGISSVRRIARRIVLEVKRASLYFWSDDLALLFLRNRCGRSCFLALLALTHQPGRLRFSSRSRVARLDWRERVTASWFGGDKKGSPQSIYGDSCSSRRQSGCRARLRTPSFIVIAFSTIAFTSIYGARPAAPVRHFQHRRMPGKDSS